MRRAFIFLPSAGPASVWQYDERTPNTDPKLRCPVDEGDLTFAGLQDLLKRTADLARAEAFQDHQREAEIGLSTSSSN